jgi:hypothetical protein
MEVGVGVGVGVGVVHALGFYCNLNILYQPNICEFRFLKWHKFIFWSPEL